MKSLFSSAHYQTQLLNKVNGYKSYSNEVKSILVNQILSFNGNLDKTTFDKVYKNIPLVLKNNATVLKETKNLTKLVVKLERHAYAPELNCLHLSNGTILKTPQKTTIAEAVKYSVLLSLKK